MNDNEWNELQRLWTSLPPQAAPVTAELERLRRRRGWSAAGIAIETLMALAGLGMATWLLTQGGAFLVTVGIATIVFVAVVCALSAWARMAPRPNAAEPVARAVAMARRQALLGVRFAAATVWAIVAALVFSAVMALGRGLLTTHAQLAGFVALGAVQLMLAVWLACAFWYYRARSAALVKLDAIAADLQQ
jgi:ferric-dicitrate binding protein FerR (iron transport regulator)